jgi:hypothetical protein
MFAQEVNGEGLKSRSVHFIDHGLPEAIHGIHPDQIVLIKNFQRDLPRLSPFG